MRWPFERAAWMLERRVLWPLQRRLAGRGAERRDAGLAALGALGLAAILAVLLFLPGSGEAPSERAAAPAPRVAVVAAAPQSQTEHASQARSLHGVPPHFGVGKSANVTGASGEAGSGEGAGAGSAASADPEETSSAGEATAAASSSAAAVPAGPAAMQVAHRFAEAFVFYEIGEKPARAKAVFDETATEQLATALDERPPRLPANAKVPKAEVVNLVAGPRFGRQYTVSVSLLRVGVTSELRLTLQKEKDGEWSVAQILG